MMTSVLGTRNLLELAERAGARFLQASTSEVYGDPEQHPQHESYWGNVNPTGPRACYDEGKRAAEALCFDFVRGSASTPGWRGSSTPMARACARRWPDRLQPDRSGAGGRAAHNLRQRLSRPAHSAMCQISSRV